MKKDRRESLKRYAADFLFWCAGGLLYAAAINIFTSPNNIVLGGFSGIAVILNYLFGLPVGTVIFILNIPFFIAAFYKFGFGFIIKTVAATLISSALIDITEPIFPVWSGDKLLCAVYGGLLAGAGLGVVFLHGATTGGTDIIAKLLRLRFPHLSMGRVILYLDVAVVALSFPVYEKIENTLLSFIVIFISSQAIDYFVKGSGHSKIVFIITNRGDDVRRTITETLDRGVTLINARGGYSGEDKSVLLCAVRASDIAMLTRTARRADEGSFTVVADADEIFGEGFYGAENSDGRP